MAAQMETLDPSALPDIPPTVSYQCQAETVTFSSGVVSVAGITVVTGGVELSCRSCILAFGFWGTLIGLSCLAVALRDQLAHVLDGTSTLLGFGVVILVLSFLVMASVLMFHLLTKKKRGIRREEKREGNQVLVEGGEVIKKVTV
uniref:Transmembrane protein 100 n=1 Tax=Xiphophorus maculatus TaxID=8083 RepID=A0A3B5PN80_XIPMA